MNRQGTAQYRYRAGFDGISDFEALEISGGGEQMDPEKFRPANSPYEKKVSGQIEVTDISIKLAFGHDQNAIEDMNRWFDAFFGDVDKSRRTGWAEDLDESGTTPILAREFVNCIPVRREHDNRSTEGKGVATITFVIACERVNFI